MKKKWMLTAVISIIIVLVGIYGLMKWNEYKTTEIVEEVETKLSKVNIDEIVSIELYDKQTLMFAKAGEAWVDQEPNKIQYEQNKIKQMVDTLANMTSFQKISNIQDQSAYGINENSKMITLYDQANNPQTFRIGSPVSGQDATYIWSDVDEAIYLVDKSQTETIWWNREDIVVKEMEIPEIAEINQMIISEAGNKMRWIKNDEVGSSGYETWLVEEAFKTTHEAKTTLVEQHLNALENFSKDKFVAIDGENLAAYGLDKPSLVIEINGNYTIKFGHTDGEYTFFKCSEEPYIYKMLTEKIKGFKGIDAFELVRKQIYIPKQETLKNITLQQGDQVAEWLFERADQEEIKALEEGNKQEDINEGDVNKESGEVTEKVVLEEGTSQVGEVILSQEQTEKLLALLEGISVYKPLVNPEFEEKQERTAEVTITYNLKDGTHHTFEFVPYDPSFYILRYKGHIEFSVEKKSVITFFNEFKNIVTVAQKEISK